MVESVTVLGVREETAAGRAIEARRSRCGSCGLRGRGLRGRRLRGRGRNGTAGVLGPITNE